MRDLPREAAPDEAISPQRPPRRPMGGGGSLPPPRWGTSPAWVTAFSAVRAKRKTSAGHLRHGLDQIGTARAGGDPRLVRPNRREPGAAQIASHKLLARLGLHPSLDHLQLESLAVEDADAETRAELAELGGALAQLPTDQRLAWMLRYVEGEQLREIARLCACSLATVKRRIVAASNHLRQHGESLEIES